MKTRITEMFGVKYPIVLAGMGPFSTHKTAVKVANAGGIGLTSHWAILSKIDPKTHLISDAPNAISMTAAKKMEHDLTYIKEHAEDGAVCGCNIRVNRIQLDWMSVLRRVLKMRREDRKLREIIKIIVTSAGDPVPPNKKIRKNNEENNDDLKHFHVSPCLRLVQRTFKSRCDGVVAVGYEGGGHQSYEAVATSVLIPIIREHYPDKPLIAGGGFYNGQTLASALALGADAVQMGTRFIATSDGDFHQNVRDLIVRCRDEDTMVITGFYGPIRLIRNKYALEHCDVLSREEKVLQEKSTDESVQEELLKKFRDGENIYKGKVEKGPVFAGQTVGGINSLPTVKEVIDTVMSECQETIRTLYSKIGQ